MGDELSGPNRMAETCDKALAELEEQKAAAKTRAERRPINQRIHQVRDMLKFARSRAGYVTTPQELGLLDQIFVMP